MFDAQTTIALPSLRDRQQGEWGSGTGGPGIFSIRSSMVSVTLADVVAVPYSALSIQSNCLHLLAHSQCPQSCSMRWHGSVCIFDMIVVRVSAVIHDIRWSTYGVGGFVRWFAELRCAGGGVRSWRDDNMSVVYTRKSSYVFGAGRTRHVAVVHSRCSWCR